MERIVDGNAVVMILSRRNLLVIKRSGYVDALVARGLEDGSGQVTRVCSLERDL